MINEIFPERPRTLDISDGLEEVNISGNNFKFE